MSDLSNIADAILRLRKAFDLAGLAPPKIMLGDAKRDPMAILNALQSGEGYIFSDPSGRRLPPNTVCRIADTDIIVEPMKVDYAYDWRRAGR